MKTAVLVAATIVVLAGIYLLWPQVAQTIKSIEPETQVAGPIEIIDVGLQHRQETWLSALEWCESRGYEKALNPQDLDGTASYGAFQFKPETFAYLTEKYALPEAELMDAEAQRAIVRHMINDPTTNWEQQFPNCVKKYVGRPPTK